MRKIIIKDKPTWKKDGQYTFLNDNDTEYSASNSIPEINDKFADKDLYTVVQDSTLNDYIVKYGLPFVSDSFLKINSLSLSNNGVTGGVVNGYTAVYILDNYAYVNLAGAGSNILTDDYDTIQSALVREVRAYAWGLGTFGEGENPGKVLEEYKVLQNLNGAYSNMNADAEYRTGNISEQRVMYINHKISTLHGEGYSALDASMLAMYSYGRALLQFKKWFVTLIQDRFKAEDIDRFGEVNIGSYRAASEFTVNTFRKYFAGEITMKDIVKIFEESSNIRKKEMVNYINGIGIGITLLSLIAIMEDDDEPDTETLRTLKKFSHDVFVTTDLNRFVNYTMVPSSYSTMKNSTRMIGEAVRGDKVQRTGPYGESGTSQAMKTAKYDVSPFAEFRKDISNLFYKGPSEKKETSSLIR